ncbi:unnamed protein product [Ceutorhynchus assimilis]|uniref:Uncharacterized protein n=1 Tax=Ceutorhynchus assimilis TaxID=467358 RepID=A0A9N9MG78_9CUCU|nr:unnamed protein product [Ceutorhynchus assimilis]
MYLKVPYFVVSLIVCLESIHCAIVSISETTDSSRAVATTVKIGPTSEKTPYEKGLEDYDEARENMRKARGMPNYDDEIIYHDDHHDHHYTTPKPKEEPKAAVDDPWEGYYDFIINEGSFKFWAAFQLVTAALLIYSAFAAVYYAKFNVITTDYDYYDDFYGRGRANTETSAWSGLTSQTFQRIMDALSSKKFT